MTSMTQTVSNKASTISFGIQNVFDKVAFDEVTFRQSAVVDEVS